jgi:PAS domain S-box-containing protein
MLSLAKQGILLVLFLLACELTFIGTLGWLLNQAEAEAARQERARQVSARAGRLMLVMYDTGDAVGRYARSLQLGTADSVSASKEEVPVIIKWLKNELKDNEEAIVLLNRIDENITICLPVITDIQGKSSTLAEPGAKEAWTRKRETIQPMVNQLIKDIPALIAIGQKIESAGPDLERAMRRQTEIVLIGGLLLNLIVAALIAYFFTNRISGRIEQLAENITRLQEGEKLEPLMNGNDEIATVDSVIHDTADAMRKEMAMLKASEARVRALIEHLPVSIAMLDAHGTIEFLNSTLEESFNYSSHQLMGKRLSKLFASGQKIPETFAHAEQFSGRTAELTALCRNGQTFPAELMMAAIDMDGESKTLAMIVDSSEKYEIKQMRQAFVAMVRTELKEPLTKVSSFFSKLQAHALGTISPKVAETTKLMQQNIERLVLLLNDLFDLDKLESGKIEIEPARENLSLIFERSINAVTVFAEKHKVQLQVNDCPIALNVDANRIVQVLVNLLSNAIKFSPAGSVVTLATRQSPGYIEIGVIDHGRGIPQAHLQSVFIAYRQVEAADAHKKGGTGLGLAICKAIVEAHNGEIGVNSEEGKGSVFWLKLPLERES